MNQHAVMTAEITEVKQPAILSLVFNVLFLFATALAKERNDICRYVNQVAVTVNSQAGQNPASDVAVILANAWGEFNPQSGV